MNFWAASTLWALGSALDIWATLYAQARGARESNRILRDAWNRLNVFAKVFGSAVVIGIAAAFDVRAPVASRWALAACGVGLAVVALTSFLRYRGKPRVI